MGTDRHRGSHFLSLGGIRSVSFAEFPVPLIQYELVHVHVKMIKHILIFVLATATTVLGQRDLYRPASGPPVAQERKIYNYTDYEDYSPQIQTRSFYRTGRLLETSD